ncbi:protein jagged-2-like isoform X2 [Babylonia areolata]
MLPSGTCCDGKTPGTGGQCPMDNCDSAFVFCFRHQSNSSFCDPIFETTPLANNDTVNGFDKKIDMTDANSTTSLVVIPINTMEPITVEVSVKEVDLHGTSGGDVIVGNFSMLLNTTHLFSPHPDWKTFQFHNPYIRLDLNATSFCSKYFFGPSCNIFCKAGTQHYTCDNDGNKVCHQGYEGVDCKTVTDLCVSHPCQNKATCQKKVNDFLCQCAPGYTGKVCDVAVPITTTLSPSGPSGQATQHQPTTTTPTPSNTTAGSGDPKKNKAGPSEGTDLGVILGPIFGVLLLALAALLLFLLYRRKTTVKPDEEQAEDDSKEGVEKGVVGSEKIQKSVPPQATQP